MTEVLVEMEWTCGCGTVNKGRVSQCVCGRPRDEHVVFTDASEGDVVVTDDTLIAQADEGALWICQRCGTANRNLKKEGEEEHCPGCGYVEGIEKLGDPKHKPTLVKVWEVDGRRAPDHVAEKTPSRNTWVIPAIISLSVAAALTLGYFFFWKTTDTTLMLASVEWYRSLNVERYQKVDKEEWVDQLPSDATITRQYDKRRSFRQVEDGTETISVIVGHRDVPGSNCGERNLQNGFKKVTLCTEPVYGPKKVIKYKSVPVFDRFAEYYVMRWVLDRSLTAKAQDFNPKWPVFVPTPTLRISDDHRVETYTAVFRGADGEDVSRSMPPNAWRKLRIGARYPAVVNSFGFVLSIQTEKPLS